MTHEEIVFLTVDQVLAVHSRMIADFGGRAEVRDRGLLESAVAMPTARFGGEYLHDGLPAMAAAYLFHLSKNHPFLDGNKRTALVASEVFLGLNHWELDSDNDSIERLTLGVAEGTLSKKDAIAFYQARARPAGPAAP